MLEFVGNTPIGKWLVLGIILAPVYGMLLAWFIGKPRIPRLAILGVVYLLLTTIFLWGGMFATSMLIKYIFFMP